MSGVIALILADARFPGGGHIHSGGLEEAASRGLVRTPGDLVGFLSGRLRTNGAVQALFAAAAARLGGTPEGVDGGSGAWAGLDAEFSARTPSAAARETSRLLGVGSMRAAGPMFPRHPVLVALRAGVARPHQALVLGAVTAAGGGDAHDAALAAAYTAVTVPATAGVKLLGMDPLVVNGLITAMSAQVEGIADWAVSLADLPPAELPSPSAPLLDVFAERHEKQHQEEVRLFAS